MKSIAKEVAADAADRKPYVRPELIKHGKVESLTQTPTIGNSHPIGGGSSPSTW